MACCQDILAIRAQDQPHFTANRLTVEQTRLLVDALNDTGPRVHEFADLAVRYICLSRLRLLPDGQRRQ